MPHHDNCGMMVKCWQKLEPISTICIERNMFILTFSVTLLQSHGLLVRSDGAN